MRKKKNIIPLFGAWIFVLAFMMLTPQLALAKASLNDLYETPKDRSTLTKPEYGKDGVGLQSYVFDGALVDVGTTNAGVATPDVVLGLGAAGIVSFDYEPGTNVAGILDRDVVFDNAGEEIPLYVTRVVADDMNVSPDTNRDQVYFLSGAYLYSYSLASANGTLAYEDRVLVCAPGDCNPSSLTEVYEATDIVIIKDANATVDKTYLGVTAKERDTTQGKVFMIAFDESDTEFARNSGEPDWEYIDVSFIPTAIAATSSDVTAAGNEYYLFSVGENSIWTGYVDEAKIGAGNSTNHNDAHTHAVSSVFDGTPRDIAVYSDSTVDSTNSTGHIDSAGDEVLVFVGTNNGIYGFELDYENSAYELEQRSNLTQSDLPGLEVYGLRCDDAGDATGKDAWLIAAGGRGGVYIFETSGADDKLGLSVKARLDTTGVSEKVFYIDPAAGDADINHIYVADGSGGFKDFDANSMNGDAENELIYQWDESVAAAAVSIVNVAANDYAAVLDQSGGIKLYDVNTDTVAPDPQDENATTGKYGWDLAWSSKSNEEGTGTNLAGTPYDMYVEKDSGTATTLHFFVAAGEAGIKKMQCTNVGLNNFLYEITGTPVEAYNTPGVARGVYAYQDVVGEFYVAVADGDAGMLMMDYNKSSGDKFTRNTQIALQGGGVAEDVYIDARTNDEYVYVAYGDKGLLVLDVRSSTTAFDGWSNPKQAALIDGTTLGGYALKLAFGSQGTDTYYLYVLVDTGTARNILAVDVSTPSSPQVVGTFTGESEANDIAFLGDSSNTGKYYLVVSSTNDDPTYGKTSRVVTVNVSSPDVMIAGEIMAVNGQANAIAARDLGGTSVGTAVVGEILESGTVNGGQGYAGRMKVTFTGAQTVTVAASATPAVVELGGTTNLNASVTGGETPYTYSWSATARTGTETGTFDPVEANVQSPTWTAPAGLSDLFTITVKVTDNDGNTGTSSVTVRARPTGVSVVNRIGKAGSTVTVPIEISGVADRSVDAWGLDITYDPTLLVFLGASKPDGLVGWQVSGESVGSGLLRVAGYATSPDRAVSPGATATLINLIFSINHGSSPGTMITITPNNAVDDIAGIELTSGVFKLVCPGDVDGSGLLTPQDALWTFYYYLDLYDLQKDEAKVADVDNDGMVTLIDAVEIMNRYVAYGGACPE